MAQNDLPPPGNPGDGSDPASNEAAEINAADDDSALHAFEHGSSGATADLAVEGQPAFQDARASAPYARPAAPLNTDDVVDQLAGKKARAGACEARLDEALEESFPASDPPSFQPRTD